MNPVDMREVFQLGAAIWEQCCPPPATAALKAHGIDGAGLSDAGRGYRMARRGPDQGHLLFCESGAGRVWVDGKWADCGEGQAYASPAGRPMAFETTARRRWKFGWLYFDAHAARPPGLLDGEGSTLVRTDPRLLLNAIRGLYQEGVGRSRTALLQQWAGLVHTYALDVVGPPSGRPIDPLWKLWEHVDAKPAAAWSVDRLAATVGLSPEALRLQCLQYHGRSPMRHVTFLRMRRADSLIRTTPAKLSVIAGMVGYTNVFAFSTAFHRCHGMPPSERRP